MSVEYNVSSEMGAGQPMAPCQKLLPPITPGGKPVFVSGKQYDAIIQLREGRLRIKEARERRALKVKRHLPRGRKGRFIKTKGNLEGTSGGIMVPFRNFTGDFLLPTVAINEEEEIVGEVAYNNILNLESPDPTTLLRIMMGDRYDTDVVSEQFQNVAHLQAPDFATLLTIMNNAGYDEAADDGYYDVEKMMRKLEGW